MSYWEAHFFMLHSVEDKNASLNCSIHCLYGWTKDTNISKMTICCSFLVDPFLQILHVARCALGHTFTRSLLHITKATNSHSSFIAVDDVNNGGAFLYAARLFKTVWSAKLQ